MLDKENQMMTERLSSKVGVLNQVWTLAKTLNYDVKFKQNLMVFFLDEDRTGHSEWSGWFQQIHRWNGKKNRAIWLVHIVNCAFAGIIHVSSRSGQRLRQLARFANLKCEALVEHDELWQEQPKTHVLHHRCSGVALSSPLLPLHALAQLSPIHILYRIYSCCCMAADLLVVTCLLRRISSTFMMYYY